MPQNRDDDICFSFSREANDLWEISQRDPTRLPHSACDPISPTIAKHIIRRSCYNRPGSLYQHQFIVYIFRLSLSLVSSCVSHIYQSCLSQLFQRLANYRLGQILLHGCQVALSPPNHLIAICLLDIGQIYFTFGDLEKTRLAIWTNTFSNLDNHISNFGGLQIKSFEENPKYRFRYHQKNKKFSVPVPIRYRYPL